MEEYDSVHTEREREEGGKAERERGKKSLFALHKPLSLWCDVTKLSKK